jgi:hypothetical protein
VTPSDAENLNIILDFILGFLSNLKFPLVSIY